MSLKNNVEVIFDGKNEVVFSPELQEEQKTHYYIGEEEICAKNFEIKLEYKNGKILLHSKPFDYQLSCGLFMKLYQGEEYPILFG